MSVDKRCFHGIVLRFALSLLGVKVQTTAPHSPWQNGRIERFFGTFKRDFARVVEGNLETLLAQWRFYYNFARPQATGEAQLIELWDGELRCAYFASD
jgi:putative transposase